MTSTPYITVADLRAGFRELLDEDRYPEEDLTALVGEFEGKLEDHKGYAMVRRDVVDERRTIALRSTRTLRLRWPEVVPDSVTVEFDGTEVSSTSWTLDAAAGVLTFDSWYGPGVLTASYTHGLEELPSAAGRACGLYVWHEALAAKSPNTGNAYVRTNTELGIVERESTADPDRGRLTGWMDVDRLVVGVRSRRIPGMR